MSHDNGYPIVLTADRTLMSEYGGGIFLGFSACVPQGVVPDSIYFSMFCPPIPANKDGSVDVAPCGTRKVQSCLLDQGFSDDDVILAHPEHLGKVIGSRTKILGITENDPLGIGPATSTFHQILGGEPQMKLKFQELLRHPAVLRHRPKIIVGGPGSWQLTDAETRARLGIDCVVVGEAEKVVGPLFRKALAGEQIPGLVMGEATPTEDIPQLKHATVDGIVEVSRGCGRGCEFCVPTLQRYRSLPLERIVKDVDVVIGAGRQPILHAEDVLRYGARAIEVDHEAVTSLFREVKHRPGVERVSISHFALASVASAPRTVEDVSHILALDKKNWLAGQTGIETASPQLMARYMRGKCKPFRPEDWPDTVVDAFQILGDNCWLPCATLIMGLPGEKERDVELTLELMDRLHGFRSLVVPLFFVASAELDQGCASFDAKTMSQAQTELFLRCWEHDLKWAPSIIQDWSARSVKKDMMRPLLRLALAFGTNATRELVRTCRENYDTNIGKMMAAHAEGELHMGPVYAKAVLAMLRNAPPPVHRIRERSQSLNFRALRRSQ